MSEQMDKWECCRCGEHEIEIIRGRRPIICPNPNCGRTGPFVPLTGPYLFFRLGKYGETFIPKRLADHIKTRHRFATHLKSREMWVYKGGVYTPDGEQVIQSEVRELLGFLAKEHFVKETLEAIRETTYTDPSEFEAPKSLINFKNGVFDLETKELKEHSENPIFISQLPHDYAPNAKCPEWKKWLGEVTRPEDHDFLQEWCGYYLLRDYPEPSFLMLIGTGQNGKSIFINVMTYALGETNVTTISLSDLIYSDFLSADLFGKLGNLSDDIGSGVIRNAGKLKVVTSGGRMTFQRKFGHPFDASPYAKVTYSCNQPPEIKDESDAIKFRMKVVEFPYIFAKNPVGDEKLAKDRKGIEDRLKSEALGILTWSVGGLVRFLSNGSAFSASKSTEETWLFYKRKSNPVAMFINERLEFTDNDSDWLSKEGMYRAFQEWVVAAMVKLKVSRNSFFRRMKQEGVEAPRSREHEMKRVYLGIKLFQRSNKCSYPNDLPTTKGDSIMEEKGDVGTLEHWDMTGKTESQRDNIRRVMDIIGELENQHGGIAPFEEIKRIAESRGVKRSFVEELVDQEKQRGHLYEPKEGMITRTVK